MNDLSEDNRDKFVRLAETRTNAVLEKIRVLANCANPYAYEYTDQDIREIFSALEQSLKKARAKFQNGQGRDQHEFRLTNRAPQATDSPDEAGVVQSDY